MISRPLGSQAFIGRRSEIAFLADELREADGARARFVLIEGEAGIGKSRLLGEFAKSIDGRATLAIGYCSEDIRVPYLPFAEVLSALDAGMAPAVLNAGEAAIRPDVRAAYFRSVADLIRRSAARKPLVLALEDVQSADEATLELLRFLMRGLDEARVLVLLTVRVGEEAESASLLALRSAMSRARYSVIRLGTLRRNEIRCLIQSSLRGLEAKVDPATLGELETLSEGNPLIAEELTRIAIEPGTLRPYAGVPLSLRATSAQRLHEFTSTERGVLIRAAIVGVEFDVPLVSTIAEQSLEATLQVMQLARERGIVEQVKADPMRFRFRHALIRRALADQLLVALAAPIHVRIARQIEAGSDAPQRSAELAYHWSAARVIEKARYWNEAAAQAAWNVYAYRDAIRFYTAALQWEYPPGVRRAEVYERLGKLLYIEGCAEEPARWFERCRAEHEALGNPHGAARALLLFADQCWVDARTCEGRAAAERAAAMLDALGDASMQAEAAISLARFSTTLGDPQRALEYLEPFEGELARLALPIRATFHEVRAEALALLGERRPALQEFHRAAQLAAETRDSETIAQVENNFALAAVDLGDLDLAVGRHDIAVREAHRTGMSWRVAYSSLNYASTLMHKGELANARTLMLEAIDTGVDTATFTTKTANLGTRLALMLNDRDLLRRCATDEALQLAARSGESQRVGCVAAAAAELRLAQGSQSEAGAVIAAALGGVARAHRCWPFFMVLAQIGDRDQVEAARRLLAAAPARPRVRRCYRLLFEAIVGARDGAPVAKRLAGLAARGFAQIGDRLHEALALERSGRDREALERYRQMGNLRDAARLSAKLHPPARSLTPRQRDVAQLVAQGRTNREIAGDLNISEHTVEHHLTQLFARLKLRSRAQLAAAVVRGGADSAPD